MAAAAIGDGLRRLEAWIEHERFRGWDPYDALTGPVLSPIARGPRVPAMVLVQLMKRSPINLRPLLRVPKRHNAKGMALFASSYLRRFRVDGDAESASRVHHFAEWLRSHATPGYSGAAWGYPFPWPNRGFFAAEGVPTVVNTAFAALALLETGDVETARSACEFVLCDLQQHRPSPDELCFSYTPMDTRWIYNASLLGGELLAATGAATGEPLLLESALRAARFVVRRQRGDGAWLYGVDAQYAWIDNFHTGFVLGSLKRTALHARTSELDDAIARGYAFWKSAMFRADGVPRYYAGIDYPVDAHAVAQSILTSLDFAGDDASAAERARQVADWAIRNLQDRRGYFHYQIRRTHRVRIPYMRWSQAWMLRALRELHWHEAGRPARALEVPA